MALSQGLYNRCRATLLQCDEFDSHSSLQAVFLTTELEMHQNRIPQVANRDNRVNQTIAYLVKQRLSDIRPVFPIFLAALHKRRDAGDALHSKLGQLCDETQQELGRIKVVSIPFVIAAMINDEATALLQETVFDNPTVAPIERTRFQQFRESLQEHGIADLLTHYGACRENWKPHTCQQSTIEEIISDVVALTNQQRSEIPGLPLVQPQFFSSHFFIGDEDTRLVTWELLSRLGCVIVVDAISMFHPLLRRTILHSEMGSNERVAMLVLSPVNPGDIPVNQLIEREISSQMERAFARFSISLDKLCEFGVGDLRVFQRWLFAILPEAAMIVQSQRPNPSNRKVLREHLGNPTGMDQLIFGSEGG